MSAISGIVSVGPFDVLTAYTASNATDVPSTIGALASTPDGRLFRFGYNASASLSLSPGKLVQGPAVVAAHQAVTVSAQSVGDRQITVTLGATAATANQYAGGFIGIISGTGSVATYSISGHPAANASATLLLTLNDPIAVATSSSATANLWANPYSAAIVCPTTVTGTIAGVPLVTVSTTQYAWFQTSGSAVVLNQGGTTAGLGLAPSGSVAGALATVGATTDQVAVADQAGVDGAYSFVRMQLD